MIRRIPVATPALIGNELAYVMDCVTSNWISSNGKYIELFEKSFAEVCNASFGIACCNGTVALHLALLALGVKPGDEIIVPSLTFVATANAVSYCGAIPVFADSEDETWNLDICAIESLVTERTKGIIVVHLYGHPVDMDAVRAVASRHNLFIVEDAAEAHGALYKDGPVGSLGDVGTFSFYGNKIITTGEGGMVTTNDAHMADRLRLLRGQGMDPARRYWFPTIGYNYRMTNIAAAIGLTQVEQMEWHVNRRRVIAQQYAALLDGLSMIRLQPEKPWARNAFWMTSIVLNEESARISRDAVMEELENVGIETRPFFYPMHTLPMYHHLSQGRTFPVADKLAAQGLNLPSGAHLSEDDISYICEHLRLLLTKSG